MSIYAIGVSPEELAALTRAYGPVILQASQQFILPFTLHLIQPPPRCYHLRQKFGKLAPLKLAGVGIVKKVSFRASRPRCFHIACGQTSAVGISVCRIDSSLAILDKQSGVCRST